MSQILSLIVAAAILMMIAMILIVTATDFIGEGAGDTQMQACTSSIDSMCEVRNGWESLPAQCSNVDQGALDAQYDIDRGSTPPEVDCGDGQAW